MQQLSTTAQTKTIEIQGTITGLTTGQNFIVATTTSGKVPVTVNSSTTVSTAAAPLAANSYAVLVGTGSTSTGVTATYVALFKSAPSAISAGGTVSAITAFGADIKTSAGSTIPVMIANTTTESGSVVTGASISVSGIGTTGSGIFAKSITTSGSSTAAPSATSAPASTPPPAATAGIPTHMLTGDYLAAPDGTTKVSPAQAAPYLSWAQTGVGSTNAIHAAGIKTQIYLNPNRVQTNDALYSTTASSGFSTTCGSSRVYDTFGSTTQYVTNPASSALHSSYASLVNTKFAGLSVDAVFEDNAGPLSAYGTGNFKAAMPCSYSDSAWISGEKALEASISKPTIFNGLSALNGHDPSLTIGLLSNSNTIGGTYEHCLSDGTKAEMAAWSWQAIENTQIQVVGKHKLFFCMARNLADASQSSAARLYVLASLLLTYDPSYTVLWDEFATPNGFHVLPESGFVATRPLVAQPSNITQLENSGGTYVREYAACYYRGSLIGKCAAVVNGDYYTHTRPVLSGYTHSLTVSGYDVLEGGSVGFKGSLPSTTMPAQTASILLP